MTVSVAAGRDSPGWGLWCQEGLGRGGWEVSAGSMLVRSLCGHLGGVSASLSIAVCVHVAESVRRCVSRSVWEAVSLRVNVCVNCHAWACASPGVHVVVCTREQAMWTSEGG